MVYSTVNGIKIHVSEKKSQDQYLALWGNKDIMWKSFNITKNYNICHIKWIRVLLLSLSQQG